MSIQPKTLKVLMVTSEAVPFAKSGGLADMVSALSIELKKQGVDVRIIMPRYYSIDSSKMEQIAHLSVEMGDGRYNCDVVKDFLPKSDVPVYFINHEDLFGRDGIYGPSPDKSYEDNARRYAFLSTATFTLCSELNWIPDVFHCHDWVAGPLPMLLETYESGGLFRKSASVLTIHNLGYQGRFGLDQEKWLTVNSATISDRYGTHDGDINYLKMAIENSQVITTVSPTYAKEIKSAEYGHGLDGSLRYRQNDLFGIINGIDYESWNPSKDKYIAPNNFNSKKIKQKSKVKMVLQKEAGLEVDPEIPMIGIISRLAEQKGIGALCGPSYGKLYSMCWDMDIQFVIVGTGESWCEEELQRLDSSLDNLKAWITYSNRLAHMVEAASDFFLMPSMYEPCGLNQLYSLSYGTLPIVRRTGGLADTVEPYNEETGDGTGFLFDELTPQSIYDAVGWAVSTWYDRPEHIKKMRKKAMKCKFDWFHSAKEYQNIYQWALDRKR